MATMMGVANMGGPAVGFMPTFPTPTVARGASADDAMKAMHKGGAGMKDMPGMPGMGSTPAPAGAAQPMDHSKMPRMSMPGQRAADTAARRATPSAARTPTSRTSKRAPKPAAKPAAKRANTKTAQPKKTSTPAKKPAPPMDHSNMPGMKMP